MFVTVIGAGLAGCEAAYQIAKRDIKVRLIEMKPAKRTPAHKIDGFAELVCSNSLKADRIDSAAGLLKAEMRLLDSLLVKCADKCRVPAGGALAVDRTLFSQYVTEEIKNNQNIEVVEGEFTDLPTDNGIYIIATGPLTSEELSNNIKAKFGQGLSFFDAAAPIVSAESIDKQFCFSASRYGKGDADDYINCPMNKEEYEAFYYALISAQRAELHDCDVADIKVYEGCMPVEVMAQRGIDTLRFGPMKPVGLTDPRTGHRAWAVLQLRKENVASSMYNLVGFQTNLKFAEQKRVFGMIPALHNAEFLRYGVMHRNTFLDSPRLLDSDYSLIEDKNIFFAGQITGVEGYMESASSGLMAGINATRVCLGQPTITLPSTTMIGALSRYISDRTVKKFQPMGANFGVLPELDDRPRDKKLRYQAYADRSIHDFKEFFKQNNL